MTGHSSVASLPRWRRKAAAVAALTLRPGPTKNRVLNLLGGWAIAQTAKIGHSYLDVDHVRVGAGACIGSLNFFRSLRCLDMGECSGIGNLNLISAATAFDLAVGGRGALELGKETAITNRHYLDCSGGLTIGAFTTLAGSRTTVLTHQIDLLVNEQVAAAVVLSDNCFLGSNAKVVPGSYLPSESVLAMGAVLIPGLTEPGRLYGGVPAKDLGSAQNAGYISRTRGQVSPRIDTE